ncbi:MAG: CHAD domain-containing protein [Candidatus Nanopelagicales bacterium]
MAVPTVEPNAPETFREVEVKLRVHALFRLPELVGAQPGLGCTTIETGIARVEKHETIHMRAVYHDTADLRLIRSGVTLRHREGGDDQGWHLKLPVEGAGHGVRDEVRLPLDAGAPGEVPPQLADLVTGLARHEPLRIVAALQTDRTAHVLYDQDDQAVAELVDDVVSILDGDIVAARFRELEIEALTDDHSVLDPVVLLLSAHGAVPGSSSKAGSALGPIAAQPPDIPPAGEVTPDDPAGDAVIAHLRTHVQRFVTQDMRVRRDLPDAVHQMRVAARRLRSGLRVFRPLVDLEWSSHLRDELGWIAGELGLSRDSEVLLKRLDSHADELEPEDAVRVHNHVDPVMRQRVADGMAEALEAMRSPRYLDLLDALVAATTTPQLTPEAAKPAQELLPPLFHKAWRKLETEVRGLTLEGPADEWHETRITAKRARYAAEALTPVFGPAAKALAGSLAQVTEQLGEHQDAAIAQETVRELAASFDGSTGFALGLLHAYEVECELIARIKLTEVWPAVRGLRKRTKLK